jgi:hypothetical protein
MDTYHNLFIVPLLIFLLATMLPVTFYYGTWFEVSSTVFFGVLWLVLMLFDWRTGRLDQPEWMCRWIRERSRAFLKHYGR